LFVYIVQASILAVFGLMNKK